MRRIPLLLLCGAVLGAAQSSEGGAVHFSDPMNGRLAWVVEDSMLPWTGAFKYLSSLKERTALLTVADSSTGIPLGECSTNSFGDNWESFSWTLSSTDLLCMVSQSNSSRVRFLPSQSDAPRSFSVRIQSSRGPRCLSSIVVAGVPSAGCPPILSPHGFSQLSLQCGCPYAQEPPAVSSLPIPRQIPHHLQQPQQAQLQPQSLPFLPRAPFHSFPTAPSAPAAAAAPVFPRVRLGSGSSEESPFGAAAAAAAATPAAAAGAAPVVHPCSTHVCSNGGRCTVNDAGFAECACQDGFAGRHCENDVCAQVPCGNGGRCSAKGTIAVCHCPRHTRGLLCEEVVCATPCSNGGSCQLDRAGEAVCDCPEGFTGPNCNVVDVCLGNAACSVYGPSAVCHIDEEATIAPRATLMRETPFECKCPQPASIEWVDCISLHVTPSPSASSSSSSSLSTAVPVVIPPLAPSTTDPLLGSSNSSPFQPNPNQAGPVPSSFGAHVSTTTPDPSVVPGVPVLQPHQPAHHFTFQTVIPPLGGGVDPAAAAAAAATTTTEQPGAAAGAGEMLPFVPNVFAPVTPSGVQQPVQQVRITLPPLTNVEGGSSGEQQQEFPPTSTPEGVAVASAVQPVFPLAPHQPRPLVQQGQQQQFPSTSTASSSSSFSSPATHSIPLAPHFPPHRPLQPVQQQPDLGVAVTSLPPIFPEEEGEAEAAAAAAAATSSVQPTTSTEQQLQTVQQPSEERDPFEESSLVGSGFVASTMESTVGEEWTSTVGEEERSTAGETMEELSTTERATTTQAPSTLVPFVMPPAEEEDSEEDAFRPTPPPVLVVPSTTTTTEMPSTTTSPTTTTTTIRWTTPTPPPLRVPPTAATPAVFSRPRVPVTNQNSEAENGADSASSSDSSLLSGRGGGEKTTTTGGNSAAASWIVAIVAIAVLGLLLLATALVVLRYVRQSRKLHGKYNPAREEHALSSAYAMPMATVTKEERLI